jgi:hypothetical protein
MRDAADDNITFHSFVAAAIAACCTLRTCLGGVYYRTNAGIFNLPNDMLPCVVSMLHWYHLNLLTDIIL